MRVCQVGTGTLPVGPGATGGTERFVHYLAQTLQALGHDITVLDVAAGGRLDVPYRLVELPLRRPAGASLPAQAVRGLLFGRAAARRLDELLREERFDVVNFHSQFSGLFGITVARRRGVPAFFTMHNPLWSDSVACRSAWARARFWMERRAEARADGRIYLSETVKENRCCFFGLEPQALTVVPLGIDESWFAPVEPSAAVRRRYAPRGETIVLQVARIAPYKNQITLARALPAILEEAPHTRLVFVGPEDSPRYLEKLREEVDRAGLQAAVVFAGAVPLEELAQIYGLARAFVLPSLRENCPQSLLEAMAQGKAIVGSDIAPVKAVLEGVAPLVPPLDHEGLARAVLSVLRSPQPTDRARRRAWERYRWPVAARQTVEAYQGRLSAHRRITGPEAGRSLVEGRR